MKIKKNTKTIIITFGIVLISLLINSNKVVFNAINGGNNIKDQHERFNLKSSNDNWEPQIRRSVGTHPRSVFIGDANNDGYNDIVTANEGSDDVSILLWTYETPSIVIQTPENKNYAAPMRGYYPATYGFERSEIGTLPEEWVDASDPLCSVEVIEELGNHKNVVEPYDPYEPTETNRSHLFNSFSLNSHGTVEFYMRSTKTGMYSGVCLTKGVTHLFHVMFGNQYLRTCSNVTYVNLLNVSNNQWYHIRIDFRCKGAPEYMGLNERRFKIHVDGQEFGPFIIYGNRSNKGVDRMNIWTGEWQRNYFLYVDDIGYSWDPNYDIGDNLNEGLLLSFDKNYPFNWMGYSLDGFASKTIRGNVSIPFPEDGPHSIQVFGKDSRGNIYQSDLRYFAVDTIAPTSSISYVVHKEPNIVNKSTIFTLTADDGSGSGVSMIRYKINDSDWFEYSTPFNLSQYAYSDILIWYQAIDEVGNIETVHTELVKLVQPVQPPSDNFIMIIIIVGSIIGIVVVCIATVVLRKKKRGITEK